jgi:hypothetical protein
MAVAVVWLLPLGMTVVAAGTGDAVSGLQSYQLYTCNNVRNLQNSCSVNQSENEIYLTVLFYTHT